MVETRARNPAPASEVCVFQGVLVKSHAHLRYDLQHRCGKGREAFTKNCPCWVRGLQAGGSAVHAMAVDPASPDRQGLGYVASDSIVHCLRSSCNRAAPARQCGRVSHTCSDTGRRMCLRGTSGMGPPRIMGTSRTRPWLRPTVPSPAPRAAASLRRHNARRATASRRYNTF